MADKLKQGTSVLTTFTDGEQPTAAKLNSISAQLRAAASALEDAVGDIHGESWPYHTDTTITLSDSTRQRLSVLPLSGAANRKLDIANLGRLIGPASMLNPRTISSSEVEEDTPIGVHQFGLQYVPVDRTAVVFSDPGLTSYVAPASALAAAGEYSVSATGQVICVTLTTGGTAIYDTNPRTYGGGANTQGARFNVIPDPNQISAGGATLTFSAEDAQGRRTVTLPLITHQQSNIEGTSITLDGDDINENQQIRLPRSIDGVFTAGDIIPAGFLILKNETTGYVYTEAEYTYASGTTFLVGGVDLTSAIGAGNVFSALTVGNDITSAIDDLRVKGFRHSHDREFGEPFIDLKSVIGFLEDPGASGVFIPSGNASNVAPQYLHRDGYIAGVDDGLNDLNAMRGTLMMGLAGGTAGAYTGETGESFKIRFATSHSFIYRDSSNDLVIQNGNSGGRDVVIRGSGGSGGILVAEEGMKGTHGGILNSGHPILVTGIILGDIGSSKSIDLRTLAGLDVSDDVYAVQMSIDLYANDNWIPVGHESAGDFAHYSGYWEESTGLWLYRPHTVSPGGLNRSFRAVIWYRT